MSEDDTGSEETSADDTTSERMSEDDTVRTWLVERTYSDDEQNLIILTYATLDGERYFRKERALTTPTDGRETTAAVDVDPNNLGPVPDEEREEYAAQARRTAEQYDPDDAI